MGRPPCDKMATIALRMEYNNSMVKKDLQGGESRDLWYNSSVKEEKNHASKTE